MRTFALFPHRIGTRQIRLCCVGWPLCHFPRFLFTRSRGDGGGTIIHNVTGLSYPGWLISILFAATSHPLLPTHTPISICIGNREKLLCPRRHLISARKVVCAEVCAEMRNLSSHRVSIWMQYLLLPLLVVCDVLEKHAAALDSPARLRFGSKTQLRCIHFTQVATAIKRKHNLHDFQMQSAPLPLPLPMTLICNAAL